MKSQRKSSFNGDQVRRRFSFPLIAQTTLLMGYTLKRDKAKGGKITKTAQTARSFTTGPDLFHSITIIYRSVTIIYADVMHVIDTATHDYNA